MKRNAEQPTFTGTVYDTGNVQVGRDNRIVRIKDPDLPRLLQNEPARVSAGLQQKLGWTAKSEAGKRFLDRDARDRAGACRRDAGLVIGATVEAEHRLRIVIFDRADGSTIRNARTTRVTERYDQGLVGLTVRVTDNTDGDGS